MEIIKASPKVSNHTFAKNDLITILGGGSNVGPPSIQPSFFRFSFIKRKAEKEKTHRRKQVCSGRSLLDIAINAERQRTGFLPMTGNNKPN